MNINNVNEINAADANAGSRARGVPGFFAALGQKIDGNWQKIAD